MDNCPTYQGFVFSSTVTLQSSLSSLGQSSLTITRGWGELYHLHPFTVSVFRFGEAFVLPFGSSGRGQNRIGRYAFGSLMALGSILWDAVRG